MSGKCTFCGSKGNHPEWGGHYWPCGSMKSASIRGESCYEVEIDQLQVRLVVLRELVNCLYEEHVNFSDRPTERERELIDKLKKMGEWEKLKGATS